MLNGRPKGDQTQPAGQARPTTCDSTTAALTDRDIAREAGRSRNDPTQPRQSHKRALMSAILNDPRLTAADKRSIKEAHNDGLSVQDLAALTLYELKLAHALYASGELAAKDLVVAINKLSSHVVACAQLAQTSTAGVASVSVTFSGTGPTSDRPEAGQGRQDPDIGDLIDTE